ncbi:MULTISPECIES: ABC transporter permease [unclassified Streptomyces]|uniref:ABC transporter permease n=1 Tax=unclassified Streptomyces TaxID=2593676 RepID=UPI003806BA46
MRSSETVGRRGVARALLRTARMGLREYGIEYPPAVLCAAVLPRTVLQAVFLTVLGGAAGGSCGALTAGIGASAFGAVTATVVKAPDVLINERVQGTLYRLRMTDLPLAGLVGARWLVYLVEGLAATLVAVPVVALLTGEYGLLTGLGAALPLYALMALTSGGFGLAVAVLAVGRRADVFLTNLASYLVLALSGVLAPLPGDGLRATLGGLLPLAHGIAALRALHAGEGPVLTAAAAEALVGVAWGAVAVLGLRLQAVRSRRTGSDFLF